MAFQLPHIKQLRGGTQLLSDIEALKAAYAADKVLTTVIKTPAVGEPGDPGYQAPEYYNVDELFNHILDSIVDEIRDADEAETDKIASEKAVADALELLRTELNNQIASAADTTALETDISTLKANAEVLVEDVVAMPAVATNLLTISQTPNNRLVKVIINGVTYLENSEFTVNRLTKTITWNFTSAVDPSNGGPGFDLQSDFTSDVLVVYHRDVDFASLNPDSGSGSGSGSSGSGAGSGSGGSGSGSSGSGGGSGSGSGTGTGDASGAGSGGSGTGDASGSGAGSGDASGSGEGSGSGDASGSGEGSGSGDASGSGSGSGDASGSGEGSGSGDASGSGSGSGDASGSGEGSGSGAEEPASTIKWSHTFLAPTGTESTLELMDILSAAEQSDFTEENVGGEEWDGVDRHIFIEFLGTTTQDATGNTEPPIHDEDIDTSLITYAHTPIRMPWGDQFYFDNSARAQETAFNAAVIADGQFGERVTQSLVPFYNYQLDDAGTFQTSMHLNTTVFRIGFDTNNVNDATA